MYWLIYATPLKFDATVLYLILEYTVVVPAKVVQFIATAHSLHSQQELWVCECSRFICY